MATTLSVTPAGTTAAPPAASPFVAMQPLQRLAVLLAFALYLLVAGGFAWWSSAPGAQWIIPALGLYLALVVLPIVLYRRSYGWFHPLIFGAFLTLLGLLRAFPVYAWGLPSHIALPGYSAERLGELLAIELFLSTIALAAYYLAFWFAPAPRVPVLRFRHPRHLPSKVMVVLALSLVAFSAYLAQQGGLIAHIISWGRSRHVALAGDFYWLTLSGIGLQATMLWFVVRRRAWVSPAFWIAAAISLAVTFLTYGSRSSVVYALGTAFLVWMLRERKIAVTRTLLLAVFALLVLAVLGDLRRSTWGGGLDLTTLTEVSPLEAIGKLASGEMMSRTTSARGPTPIFARVPDEVDYLYGKSYLAVITLPVPRSFWPDKPGLISGRVAETFFLQGNSGIPSGPVGEAYWNFDIPGVVVVFLLFGVFHKWMARLLERYPDQPLMLLVYVVTLFTAHPSSDQFVPYLLTVIPIIGLALAFGMVPILPRIRIAPPAQPSGSA